MNAGDKFALYLEPLIKQVGENTYEVEADSIIEIVWTSISGIKGEKGDPGGATTNIQLTDTPNSYVGQKGKIERVKNDETGIFFSDDITEIEADINTIKDEISKDVSIFANQSVNHVNENFYRFSPVDPTLDSTKNYKLTVRLGSDSFGCLLYTSPSPRD